MQITPQIALVGSGQLGLMLSDRFDCNVYLVDCGGELALIDAGAGRDVERLLHNIRDDGFDPANIRHIVLTHAHADHAGGCAELRARLGCAVWASAKTAQWLRAGDEAAISLDVARAAGIYPPDYQFPPCPVAHVIEDSVPFTISSISFTPLATPGHADDHVSYLAQIGGQACLFAGDLVMADGRVLLQATYDCRPHVLAHSLLRLADTPVPVEAFFPGHLQFRLHDGHASMDAALAYTRKLLLPPSVG